MKDMTPIFHTILYYANINISISTKEVSTNLTHMKNKEKTKDCIGKF